MVSMEQGIWRDYKNVNPGSGAVFRGKGHKGLEKTALMLYVCKKS
jgi:hypothetical protein